MKSPGQPTHRREVERLFWREIAKGLSSEEAGASLLARRQAAGSRWFRERGGMPTFMLAEPSGRYLSFREREEIAILNGQGVGVREIARRLGRVPVDDLQGAAPQRGHARAKARVPRIGRAMEGRADRAAPEDREARRQRAGFATTCRSGSPARFAGLTGRRCRARTRALEGPQQAAPPGPPVGERVEPGADIRPAADRLPR